jgi:hypothetical protein
LGSSREKQQVGFLGNDQPVARPWTAAFTRELAESLVACPSMDDLQFRIQFLRRVGELLRRPGPFQVENNNEPRRHAYAMAYACKEDKDQGEAVTALAIAMGDLQPDPGALARLEHCDDALKGLTALSTDQLAPILDLIDGLPGKWDNADFRELARQAASHEVLPLSLKVLPLWGTKDLPGIVRRLNRARLNMSAGAPWVLRFIALLANSLEGDDRSQLETKVEHIAGELGLSRDEILAESSDSAPRTLEERLLQIHVENESPLGSTPRYTIKAAIFNLLPKRKLIAWLHFGKEGPAEDIDDAGRRFLRRISGESDIIGVTMVEFLLPWSLLDHPVERWALDENGYSIAYQFPVVVRSLDRRHHKFSYADWVKRWKILVSDGDKSVGERIGWLNCGSADMSAHAGSEGRIIQLTGGHDVVRWLKRSENSLTAALGLAFPYRPSDSVCLNGVKDAIYQGIPLIVWCRENSDVDKLKRLLESVKLCDLQEAVHTWRCLTADGDASPHDALQDVVLLLDDPTDVINPDESRYTAPQDKYGSDTNAR